MDWPVNLVKAYETAKAPEELAEYARKIVENEDLFLCVQDNKKSTLQAFAFRACDSPLCEQLLFLYEWLLEHDPSLLEKHDVPGKWVQVDGANHTRVEELPDKDYKFLPHEIRGIQPVLRFPKYVRGSRSSILCIVTSCALSHGTNYASILAGSTLVCLGKDPQKHPKE
eukprot:3291484-Amphidinium_carterae.1